jgi:hypothetical protein
MSLAADGEQKDERDRAERGDQIVVRVFDETNNRYSYNEPTCYLSAALAPRRSRFTGLSLRLGPPRPLP